MRNKLFYYILFSGKMGANNKPINEENLQKIKNFLRNGLSHRRIASLVGVSMGLVSKIRRKLDNPPTKNRGGRPKILSEADERKILRDLRSQKFNNAVELKRFINSSLNITISAETIRRTLRNAGLRGRAKVKKPLLSAKHMKQRLDFAKNYSQWTAEDWEKVIWSDETKINRLGSDGREWVWRTPGARMQPCHVKPTLKFGGGSIMIWGDMMTKGVGTVHRIHGKMTAASYVDILSTELPASAEKLGVNTLDIVFQQDNDPKHTARLTREWLERNNIRTLKWPPQSPDLNPIEHLWGILKRSIAGETGSMDELWEKVQDAWQKIPADVCKNLVDSMPRRIKAVIDAKGGYTKY